MLEFIGIDTRYDTADGHNLPRLHLDGAASPLACKVALDTTAELLPHYSNSHSYVHNSAKISTNALAWAHDELLNFLDASPDLYTAIFIGAGTTAAINRVARGLSVARAEKKIVLVSPMEHHANDLPHRQFGNQVHYLPLQGHGALQGAVDLQGMEALFEEHSGNVNYVAVSSVSNVTGIRNPIEKISQIAHKHGALVVVDGAQSVAHGPSELNRLNADFFIFSGHKLYTPFSPGVLVAKKNILQDLPEQDLGGGSVSTVSYYDYQLLATYPDREQSGTPNIAGSIALASVLKRMNKLGLEAVSQHSSRTMTYLVDELKKLPNITFYGDPSLARIGAVSFNHKRIDHGLVAAILNDYYAIAVRNECFCAHPYVSSLLKEELWQLDLSNIADDQQEDYINRKRGMVRISISLYNSTEDVDRLISALTELDTRIDELDKEYQAQNDGSYVHKTFNVDWRSELSFID